MSHEEATTYFPLASLIDASKEKEQQRNQDRQLEKRLFELLSQPNSSTQIIEFITSSNVNVNAKDEKKGLAPIHYSIEQAQLEVLDFLLREKETDVNTRSKWEWTPLHTAVAKGSIHAVRMLLAHPKVDVNARDTFGRTALHLAVEKARTLDNALAIVKALVRAPQILLEPEDDKNRTPLALAKVNKDDQSRAIVNELEWAILKRSNPKIFLLSGMLGHAPDQSEFEEFLLTARDGLAANLQTAIADTVLSKKKLPLITVSDGRYALPPYTFNIAQRGGKAKFPLGAIVRQTVSIKNVWTKKKCIRFMFAGASPISGNATTREDATDDVMLTVQPESGKIDYGETVDISVALLVLKKIHVRRLLKMVINGGQLCYYFTVVGQTTDAVPLDPVDFTEMDFAGLRLESSMHVAPGTAGSVVVVAPVGGVERAVKLIEFAPSNGSVETDLAALLWQREVRLMMSLSHPHVVTVHGGTLSDRQQKATLIMEALPLRSLRQFLENWRGYGRGPLPIATVATVAMELASALAYLHANNIPHRDIRSVNVLLSSLQFESSEGMLSPSVDNEPTVKLSVKLGDFASSRAHALQRTTNSSRHSLLFTSILLTFPWRAPEQARDLAVRGAVSTRFADLAAADIYALGVVLWELHTVTVGNGSYDDPSVALGTQLEGASQPRRALTRNPHVSTLRVHSEFQEKSPQLASVIAACLRTRPEMRPSAARLLSALQHISVNRCRGGTALATAVRRLLGEAETQRRALSPSTTPPIPPPTNNAVTDDVDDDIEHVKSQTMEEALSGAIEADSHDDDDVNSHDDDDGIDASNMVSTDVDTAAAATEMPHTAAVAAETAAGASIAAVEVSTVSTLSQQAANVTDQSQTDKPSDSSPPPFAELSAAGEWRGTLESDLSALGLAGELAAATAGLLPEQEIRVARLVRNVLGRSHARFAERIAAAESRLAALEAQIDQWQQKLRDAAEYRRHLEIRLAAAIDERTERETAEKEAVLAAEVASAKLRDLERRLDDEISRRRAAEIQLEVEISARERAEAERNEHMAALRAMTGLVDGLRSEVEAAEAATTTADSLNGSAVRTAEISQSDNGEVVTDSLTASPNTAKSSANSAPPQPLTATAAAAHRSTTKHTKRGTPVTPSRQSHATSPRASVHLSFLEKLSFWQKQYAASVDTASHPMQTQRGPKPPPLPRPPRHLKRR